MILDSETSHLYFSEHLQAHQDFFSRFASILDEERTDYQLLKNTRDIWAVDYMPVQVAVNKFIQFRYQPDYLQNKKYIATQTNSDLVCEKLDLNTIKSDIVIDGGNVIKGKSWVILTDKIFKENPSMCEKAIVTKLEGLFDARVIVIPREPYDFTGHADGMLRYYDEGTLLINDYGRHLSVSYHNRLKKVLAKEGFDLIPIPYAPHPSNLTSAEGMYINFLEVRDLVMIPIFRKSEDEKAFRMFEQLFPNDSVRPIDACEIAKDGGVFHCISWAIATSLQDISSQISG